MDYIASPIKSNLHVLMKFFSTHHITPKITFSINEHRSWIDIIVKNEHLFKDMFQFQNNYLHQVISGSHERITTMPDATDQVLVFSRKKHIKLFMTGTSHKKFRIIKNIKSNKMTHQFFNLLLMWSLLAIPGSLDSVVSLQGDSYQLKTYLKCETNKPCPELKVYWIPDQLNKYKSDSHNEPSNCLKQPIMRLSGNTYCLNFSSDSSKQKYYAYISVVPITNIFVKPHHKENQMSWNDATSMCESIGGFLPIIRSKSELDEFIALVTFSQYIPPQNEVFIGLSTKINSKVITYSIFYISMHTIGK